MIKKINNHLSPEQKLVLFENGTEIASSNELNLENGTTSS